MARRCFIDAGPLVAFFIRRDQHHAWAVSHFKAQATPFATCLTNNGDGTISFRLNQTTGTNDLVAVIVGTTTNFLQIPSGDPANLLSRGLIAARCIL